MTLKAFEIEREVTECYRGEIEVPDDILAKGDDAVREWIFNNPDKYLGFRQCGIAPSPFTGGSLELV